MMGGGTAILGLVHRSSKMASILAVPVSQELLARLTQRAAEQGTTPEAIAAADLEQEVASPDADPLLACIGMVASDAPDAAERHDEYLGRGILAEMNGGTESTHVR